MTLVAAHAYNVAKPTGLDGTRPAWSLTRTEAQALTRPEISGALIEIERRLPDDARVRVAALDEWSTRCTGPKLERHVVPLPGSDPLAAAERLDWTGSWSDPARAAG